MIMLINHFENVMKVCFKDVDKDQEASMRKASPGSTCSTTGGRQLSVYDKHGYFAWTGESLLLVQPKTDRPVWGSGGG